LFPMFTAIPVAFPQQAAQPSTQTPLVIAGQRYEKLATRTETLAVFQRGATQSGLEWGAWEILGPLDRPGGSKRTLEPLAPASELDRFERGGSGPRRGASFVGKDGRAIEWHALPAHPAGGGDDGFDEIDFKALFAEELGATAEEQCVDAAVFVHRTVRASTP